MSRIKKMYVGAHGNLVLEYEDGAVETLLTVAGWDPPEEKCAIKKYLLHFPRESVTGIYCPCPHCASG